MKYQTMLAKLLGLQSVALNQGAVHLTENEDTKLKTLLGEEDASLLLAQVKDELSGVASTKEELAVTKSSLTEKEQEVEEKAASIAELEAKVKTLTEEKAELENKVQTLSNEPETEASAQIQKLENNMAQKVFETAGQLFGLEGRIWNTDAPWNAKALSGAKGSTTDFRSSAVIERMNDDFLDYIKTYPNELESLFNEHFHIPEHWPRITGVADRLLTATVSVANVTQPRKARWSPKGDIVFKAEEMRVYPVQIDLQFNYWELQKIETNWLNGFNKEGSQAYKMSFIAFLIAEFLKKARQEDADVLVRGIHIETPEERDKEKAVSYLYRGDGLLKIIFDARESGKYRAFNLGAWSFSNCVDYIDNFITAIPENVRNSEQLQMILAPSKIRDYKRRYEQIFGGNTNYDGYPANPKDYPNIKFVPLSQLEGSDIIIVTTMDNIKVLEFKPEEKALFTIEKFLRDVYVFADYRLGIGINHIGLATVDGDPLALTKQVIWTNNVPLFSANFFVTSYDDKTGILKVRHNRVKPDSDFSTDIKEISGEVGDILIIRGDISMATDVKIKHGDKIKLEGNADFSLRDGGDLTLIKTKDGKYKEIARTSSPALEPTAKEFTDNEVLEYTANEFIYIGEDATLGQIKGGLEGNRVRITAGEGKSLTINSDAGNVKVNSEIVLDGPTKFIDLVFVNGVWTEISRA